MVVNAMDINFTSAVFNQLVYTKGCVESLNRAGISDSQIIIVNNASTDDTVKFLVGRPEIRTIHNTENRGCGFAWTQGAKISGTPWTVVMNNDVLVPPGSIEGLISFAEEKKIDIVSPAMCEGKADYDLTAHATDFMRRMNDVYRRNVAHGVCFMVHQRVFDAIGYFDSDPKLGGYEDDEYFRRARGAGLRLAMTGRAFLHHFGSITQKSIQAKSSQPRKSLGDRAYYRRKTGQTWIKRKVNQIRQGVRDVWWRHSEFRRFGHTLLEIRGGTRRYK